MTTNLWLDVLAPVITALCISLAGYVVKIDRRLGRLEGRIDQLLADRPWNGMERRHRESSWENGY